MNKTGHKPVHRVAQLLMLWAATNLSPVNNAARAQSPSAVPPPGAGDIAGQPDTNPPAVAGNLSSISGAVSFHASGETQWSQATINYPVTSGEGFWTEPQASATIDVASNRIVLDESTEFDITSLDQSEFTVTAAQGAVFIQLADMASGQSLTVNTPRGSIQITQAGDYEIVAGDTNDATMVNVVNGAAHVAGNNLALDIAPQQSATITGSDAPQGSVGALQMDAFLKTQLQLAQQTAPLPRQCRNMTGARSLARYGSFQENAQYGQVWYPNEVPSDWTPYRDGHWSYVSPWGWTWVDNAPWGFAPFHYGRWAEINNRWGWIPGGGVAADYDPGDYPVYSPALVTFVGVGAGFGGGFSANFFAGGYAPAWIPLGPREPFYPWYHFREGYFARVNGFYGVPRDIIQRGPAYINQVNFRQTNIFINRRFATAAPADAFARGQAIRQIGRPVPEGAMVEAHPFGDRLAVRPTAFTPNLPREAAQHFHIAVPPHAARMVPGPRIMPISGGRSPMPELRHATLPQNIHAAPAQDHPAAARAGAEATPRLNQPPPRPAEPPVHQGATLNQPPHTGEGGSHELPPLRAPGARPEYLQHPQAVPKSGGPGQPTNQRETSHPGPESRPGGVEASHGLPPSTETARPRGTPGAASGPQLHQTDRPSEGRNAVENNPRREAPRTGPESIPNHVATPHEEHARPSLPTAGQRPMPRAEEPKPAPHVEAPRPSSSRVEAPRPSPHVEAPRPSPHVEAPRPSPHVEAPRPPPHVEAPRPAQHTEQPPSAPHNEKPRPAPHAEAPRPAPHAEAPRPPPAPHPAPHPPQPAHPDAKQHH